MEGHCSTGQSPQWAVVPMEEEESFLLHVSASVLGCLYRTHTFVQVLCQVDRNFTCVIKTY